MIAAAATAAPASSSAARSGRLAERTKGKQMEDSMTDEDAMIFGTLEVDTLRFEHGKPLVRPGTSLTTIM